MAETANRRVRYYDLNGNGPFVSDAMTETEAGVFANARVGSSIESADEVEPTPDAVYSEQYAPPVQVGETVYEPGIAEPAPPVYPVATVVGPSTVPAEGGAEFRTPASVQPTDPAVSRPLEQGYIVPPPASVQPTDTPVFDTVRPQQIPPQH